MRTLHETLGVSPDASREQIDKAYRKLAMQFHPDRCPGDKEAEAKFKEINAAYESLTKPKTPHQAGPRHGFNPFDFFGGMFGDQPQHPPLVVEVPISFTDSYFGCTQNISVDRVVACEGCDGSGAAAGGLETCDQCNGLGAVHRAMGAFQVHMPCPKCRQRGRTIKTPCGTCSGSGTRTEKASLTFDLPPGIRHDGQAVIRGQGHVFNGVPGDVFAHITVSPHPLFRRVDSDVTYRLPITYSQAVFGADLSIPTPDGDRPLTIPPGTQSGTMFRLPGHGFPTGLGPRPRGRGDLAVEVVVAIPTAWPSDCDDLFERLRATDVDFHSPPVEEFRRATKEMA